MPTFIKTGYWEKIQKGYKGWLNLDDVVSSSVFKTLTINTSGQSTTISNFYPAGTDGQNVYIGGGGLLGSGIAGESSYNVSLGVNALKNQTTGGYNVAIGWEAGRDLSTGGENILIGWQSGLVITTGFQNIFIGGAAGDAMTTGYRNTVVGNVALSANTNGLHNVAFGRNAMRFGTTGSENVAIGNDTLWNVTGNRNTALGYVAGTTVVTNTNSVFLGAVCNPAAGSGTNEVVIGYAATGNGSNTTVIGNTSTLSTRLHGNLLLGTNANSTYILDAVGTARVQGTFVATGTSYISSISTIGTYSPFATFNVVNDGPASISCDRFSTNALPTHINLRKSRGTSAAPTIVATSDELGYIGFWGHDGTAFQRVGIIYVRAANVTGSTITPTMQFGTGTSSGANQYHITIHNSGNVAFGNNAPEELSAQISIASTTKGFLPPRMTSAQKTAIATPATGLVVYDTTLNKLCVYTGAAWQTVSSA